MKLFFVFMAVAGLGILVAPCEAQTGAFENGLIQKAVSEARRLVEEVRQAKPAAGVCGELIGSEITITEMPSRGPARQIWHKPVVPPESWWGCHENPYSGLSRERRPLSWQDAEAAVFQAGRQAGREYETAIVVGATWYLDAEEATTVRGTAFDQDGHPVKDGDITLLNRYDNRSFSTRTDSAGRYERKVPSGLYSISLKKSDCTGAPVSLQVCGWGPVKIDPPRRQSVFVQNLKAECIPRAEARYQGTLDVRVISSPPGGGTWTFPQKHEVEIVLRRVQSKQHGRFWEGLWKGTLSTQIRQDPHSLEINPVLKVNQLEVSKVVSDVEMYLESDPSGTRFSATSYFQINHTGEFNVAIAGKAYGGPPVGWRSFSESDTKAASAQITRSPIELKAVSSKTVTILPIVNAPPFGSLQQPYASILLDSPPAAITIEQISAD
jgi:hypothetical protein